MSRPGDDGDFLARWSARKLKARAEPVSEPAPEPAPTADAASPPAPSPETPPEKSDAEFLEELGLPDPDSLVKGDDFKAFMRAGVPARLRNRALRRLWVSDPVLANLDGLNDYDKDFTNAATVMPALKTAYKVGRGFLRDEPQAPAAAEAAADASAAEEATQAPAETAPEEIDETAPEEIAEEAPEAPESTAASETEPFSPHAGEMADDANPRPRRMRFRFDAG